MLQNLIGNLPFTFIPVILTGYREMALLKIADTACAFLVWNDTDEAHTSATLELSGKAVHFVCVCGNCELLRTGKTEKLWKIADVCRKNGVKTLYVRHPGGGRSCYNDPEDLQMLDVSLEDKDGMHGDWKDRLQESLTQRAA